MHTSTGEVLIACTSGSYIGAHSFTSEDSLKDSTIVQVGSMHSALYLTILENTHVRISYRLYMWTITMLRANFQLSKHAYRKSAIIKLL